MPIYVYRCGCGVRFERLVARDAPTPACPSCGGEPRKVPAGFSLGGQANPGLARDEMPQTWRGVYHGDRDYVTRMRRQWEQRQRLEARHPELAGDQRPILAHEGRYHDAPLRAGDPVLGGPPSSTAGHGHGHGHGQGHGHGHGHEPGGGSSGGGPGSPPEQSGAGSASTPAPGGPD